MSSDVSSMRATGGMEAEPKTFRPEDLAGVPVFKPQGGAAEPKKGLPKIVFLIAGGAAFLVLAGLVFYFFIRPALFPAEEIPVAPKVSVPEPTPPTEPTPGAPTIPQFKHQSFLNPAPTLKETVTLEKLALADFSAALAKVTSDTQASGTVKELVLASETVGGANLLSLLLPELDNKFVETNLEKDFVAVAYYDKDGVWPAYVLRLKAEVGVETVKTTVASIEKSTNLINFYLTSPGTPKTTTFKDGTPIKDNPVRYLAYSKAGASFNYAWLGNNLVLSTSFNGFKEVAKLLGF